MKVAVCGKGGVGKTFIAGSLAEHYSRAGHPVIAIDADSSPNLALTLGVSPDEAARIVPVAENDELIRLKTVTSYPGVFRLTFSVDDIVTKFAVRTPAGPALLIMGTVKAMGSGCTCPAHSVIKALMQHVIVERDEVVILDMEAGIEHLGRGTAAHVDTILVVTDSNRKSLGTASAIIRIARDAGIPQIRVVGNRIAGLRDEETLRSFARENRVTIAALIPYDNHIADAGITGEPVSRSESAALAGIAGLASLLLQEHDRPGGMSGGDA